jgi:hypothetical protein
MADELGKLPIQADPPGLECYSRQRFEAQESTAVQHLGAGQRRVRLSNLMESAIDRN